MRAGNLRDIVTFKSPNRTGDGLGGYTRTDQEKLITRGRFMPRRGREGEESDRTNATSTGILQIRYNALSSTLTEADTAVIDGVDYQIRSISQPDRRNRVLEMVLERGVVT